jgi:hypothetical protein
MKNIKTLVTVILVIAALQAHAQGGFDQLIKANPADATKLTEAYGEPLFKGLGTGVNGGWYNSARPKKPFHLEIRVTATAAIVPSIDQNFDVTKIGLSNHVQPLNALNTITPTFGGSSSAAGATLNTYDDNGRKLGSFTMPSGQTTYTPAPNVQATLGIFKNTDVTVRYIPSINVSNNVGSVSMLGFGLRHDIIQDFAGGTAKKLIPFDLAVAFGYSKLKVTSNINVSPDDNTAPKNSQQSTDFSNQQLNGQITGCMGEVILSKKLLFFTPFVAVGYQTSATRFSVLGNYPVTTNTSGGKNYYTTYTNPVNIDETSTSGPRADAGLQLDLLFLKIYASYSLSQYRAVNAGIGLGF